MIRKLITSIFIILSYASSVTAVLAQSTAAILPQGKTQFLDNNGNPLSSGRVFFYIPSTTTFKTTWQDAAKTIANTNPVILDAGGRAIIYGDGTYRQQVRTSANTLIYDVVTASAGTGGGTTGTGDGDLVGTVKPWAGLVAPNQYAFAYGQELSRATYSVLFTALTLNQNINCSSGSPILTGMSDTSQIPVGSIIETDCVAPGSTVLSKTTTTVTASSNSSLTTSSSAVFFLYGNGNGSTTFNLPDLRGYVVAGRTNMGGTASANLTSTYFLTNPQATGAKGGQQSIGLSTANMAPYTPAGTTSGSVSITDSRTWSWNRNALNNVAGGGIDGSVGQSAGAFIVPVDVTGSITGSITNLPLTGTPQGGTSTQFTLVQPTITLNYIIKITPDSNSADASGVTSLGGMTGDIACGTGLLCTGNIVSVTSSSLVIDSTGITNGTSGNTLYNKNDKVNNTSAPGIPAEAGNYPAQFPGGTISVGSNTKTLAPCPYGLNGSDTNHYVYISGGVGTAEAALITGGTCTSGAASGTIIFTAANTHSGAYSISSATGGIDEAQRFNANATVIVNNGTTNVYATITPLIGTSFECSGGTNNDLSGQPCVIVMFQNGVPLFKQINDSLTLRRLTLRFDPLQTASAGSIGIQTICCTTANAVSYKFDDNLIYSFYNGIDTDGAVLGNMWRNGVYNSVSHGIIARSVQGDWDTFIVQSNGGDAFRLLVSTDTPGGRAAPWVKNAQTFNNGGWGVFANVAPEFHFSYLNFDYSGEMYVNVTAGAGVTPRCGILNNSKLEVAGGTITFGTNNSAPGILVESTSLQGLCVYNSHIDSNLGNGIVFNNSLNSVSNSRIYGNGTGGVVGNTFGVVFGAAASFNEFIANNVNDLVIFDGSHHVITNNTISGNHVSAPAVNFLSTTSSLLNRFTDNWISNALGGNALTIVSGVTINAPFSNVIFSGAVTNNGTIVGTVSGIQLISTVGTGTAPLSVNSTTLVPNLYVARSALTDAVAVGGITGLGTGVATWLATPSSANLASAVTGETGSGALVFGTSPTLASPTFTGTVTIPTPFTLGATSVTSTGTQLNYLNAATGTTGTASTNVVFSTSPTLVTPNLGTPSAVTLTNATGLPIGGITGLGTGVATALALTVTGTGGLVQLTDPTFQLGASQVTLNGTGSNNSAFNLNLAAVYAGTVGAAGTINGILTGTAVGDSAWRSQGALWFGAGGAAGMKLFTSLGLSIGGFTDPGAGGLYVDGATITLNGLTTDATHTDRTVCQDTTSKSLFFGSGALGVCLGTSGRQFKTAFAPMTVGINELMKINFYNYRYKNGYGDDGERIQYGTTAQDVEAIIPNIARQNEKGETINYDYGALLFVGLKAIQELKADNDNLRLEVEKLKNRK